MLSILLFFILGIGAVGFLLTPFAKRAEYLEKQVKKEQKLATKHPIEKQVNDQQNKQTTKQPHKKRRTSDSILDQLTTEQKERTEIAEEKEEVIFKLREQANRREAFRVGLTDTACTYTLYPNGLEAKGKIMDISVSGMKLHTPNNFVFQPNMYLVVSFSFQGEEYVFKGMPLRKRMVTPYRFEYGILFEHEDTKKRETLFRALWQEHRKRSSQII